jgi:DNA-binding NtrC family response regulator
VTEQGAVPMIVMTRSQDHVEAINSTLRKAGHPVHCTWLPDARDLSDAITQLNPEMLVAFIDELGTDLGSIMKVKQQSAPEMPVLIVREQVDENAIAEAMRFGAQDVVTLANRSRLQSVATRELRCRPPSRPPASTGNSCRNSWRGRPMRSRTCRKASSSMPIGHGSSCSAIPATTRSPAPR